MLEKCNVIEPVTEIDRKLYELCAFEFRTGFIEIGDEKTCLPLKYKEIAEKIENFQVRDTDIFVVSHPKAGTTWTQEMVWLLAHNLDYEGAKANIIERYSFLELDCILDFDAVPTDPELEKEFGGAFISSIEEANNFKGTPRFIKTHLPWCLLPRELREGKTNAKVSLILKEWMIIYVARNPKDTCVSYYHHSRNGEGYIGSFEDFCKLFLGGRVIYGPFWKNVLPYWERRNDSNVMFVKYEDMKKDLNEVIKNVSEFLIHRQYSEEEISALEKHLSFESMKNNPSVNYEEGHEMLKKFLRYADPDMKFMRSGTVGSYKQEMSQDIIDEFDKWTEDNTTGTDLTF